MPGHTIPGQRSLDNRRPPRLRSRTRTPPVSRRARPCRGAAERGGLGALSRPPMWRDWVGEILGLGVTHYPPLTGLDQNMADILATVLRDPAFPSAIATPRAGRRRSAASTATTAAPPRRPRTAAQLVRHFRHARGSLDDFRPDVVIIWGDDQYENFKRGHHPAVLRARVRRGRGAARGARRRVAQRVGRAGRHGDPVHGPPRGGQVPRRGACSSRAWTWPTPTSRCTTRASRTPS